MLFMNKNKNIVMYVLLLLTMIGGAAGLAVYAKSSGIWESMTSVEAFQSYINGFGTRARIVYFVIQLMSVIIAPIPSNISTAAGGSIFGMWEAFFISTFAILSGSILVFLLARKFGKPFTEKFVSSAVADKYEKLMLSKRFELLLMLLFLLPFFPDDVICFLAGLGAIKSGRFFIIMVLTRPWGILTASAVGSSSLVIPWWGWTIIALLVALVLKYRDKIEEKLMKVMTALPSVFSNMQK